MLIIMVNLDWEQHQTIIQAYYNSMETGNKLIHFNTP